MNNFLKGLVVAFSLLCANLDSYSQTAGLVQDPAAEELLNGMSAKFKSMKSFKAKFSRSVQDVSGKTLDSSTGNILISGDAYHLSMDGQETYCDGKTVWTYIKKANEVMINEREPGADEIYPSSIINEYQTGYKYVYLAEYKDKNKKDALAVLDLEPHDRTKPIMKVRLFVKKNEKILKKWTIFERGSNTRFNFELLTFQQDVPVQSSNFTFNKSKFPNVKVIDLR